MKRSFYLKDLECAGCAAKMEDALNRLDGVTAASISFMQQRLTLEAPDEVYAQVLAKAEKAMRRIEPDVRVVV